MFCRECGAQIYNGASFCGKCGTRVWRPDANADTNVKVCPQCQYVNARRAAFCGSCGAPLSDEIPLQQQPAPGAPQPQVVPASVSVPAPVADTASKREKKHRHGGLIALLIIICILLIAAGIWLVPNGINAAREGKPVRAPWETAGTFADEDESEVPMDWLDLPQDTAD